ncbi:MAG: hypothetical protein HC880_19565 [Bacteroidia bacterium]|nr:hypothetical protein [Bacteroidia bacterium]
MDTTSFYAQELASSFRKNEGIVRSVASNLATQGYLNYDSNSGLVTLNKRINQTDSADVFLNAVSKVNQKVASHQDSVMYHTYDHDNFRIASYVSRGANASLSRSNNELVIKGIDNFPISEALNVYIIPDSTLKSVKVYGGRNLYMERGEITVGNFRFIGRNFFLLYDEFLLEMPEIDKNSLQSAGYHLGHLERIRRGNQLQTRST